MKKIFLVLVLVFMCSRSWATDYCSAAALCWLFTEGGTNPTVDDSSANSNTGTLVNTSWAAMAAGADGYAPPVTWMAVADGASHSVTVPYHASILMSTGNFSGVVWYKQTGTGGTVFFDLGSYATRWLISFTSSTRITLQVSPGYGNWNAQSPIITINDNKWHALAFTATAGGAMFVYVDGVPGSQATGGAWNLWDMANPSSELVGATTNFTEAALKKTIWTATQVNEIMDFGLLGTWYHSLDSVLNDSVWNDTVFKLKQ